MPPVYGAQNGLECTMTPVGRHAVVIGASISGLLAARALSEFYETVTVLERDRFPKADVPRRCVPQGFHPHGLLTRGVDVIEQFFPGWSDEIVAAGGIGADYAHDLVWTDSGMTLKSGPSRLTGVVAPRPVLEGQLRRRLIALSNIRTVENCTVLGVVASDDNEVVKAVRTIMGNARHEKLIPADLIVDASGRDSLSPAWLKNLGYRRPPIERIEIGVGYTTRRYRRHPTDLDGKLGVLVSAGAPNWRNGALLYHTEDCWIASIGGYLGDHAPADQQQFAAFARSLPARNIHDVVARAEPLSDFAVYRYPANVRVGYELLDRFPKNYLVIGDALCSFNPVYHQGMAVAAQEAVLLRQCLREGVTDLARRFFGGVAALIDPPWAMAVSNDLRHPHVAGACSLTMKFLTWYIGKLIRAGRYDARLTDALLRVRNLQALPLSLLQPAIIGRTLCGNLGLRGSSGASQGPLGTRPSGTVSPANRTGTISTRSASRRSISSRPDSR
jgi:2-polyprenyl-6-methoxyphenol hydroxylase-like FAD-dependent oxidoreductase